MILDLIDWLWCLLKNFFYFVVNNIFTILDTILQFVLMFLPNTPFEFEPVEWGFFGNIIGFFIPISTILTHFIGILTAISIYYGVRYLLRLIRQVQ